MYQFLHRSQNILYGSNLSIRICVNYFPYSITRVNFATCPKTDLYSDTRWNLSRCKKHCKVRHILMWTRDATNFVRRDTCKNGHLPHIFLQCKTCHVRHVPQHVTVLHVSFWHVPPSIVCSATIVETKFFRALRYVSNGTDVTKRVVYIVTGPIIDTCRTNVILWGTYQLKTCQMFFAVGHLSNWHLPLEVHYCMPCACSAIYAGNDGAVCATLSYTSTTGKYSFCNAKIRRTQCVLQ